MTQPADSMSLDELFAQGKALMAEQQFAEALPFLPNDAASWAGKG